MTSGSARVEDVEEPPRADGDVLVETIAIGVCGTDEEIVGGAYGSAPPGRERLVLGHESLGRVLEAPADRELARGDLVVGIVRRSDPVPCRFCAVGEWDMCCNGRYTEHGIKGRDGFARERYRIPAELAIRVDRALGDLGVLLEPASVVAKAWEHIERIGSRARWQPERVLVTGAGPVGLLAALLASQRALEVHVLDRAVDGPKPRLVRDLGGAYHVGPVKALPFEPDIVIECTGDGSVVFDVVEKVAPSGIVCLAGMSSGGHAIAVDVAAWNRTLVLENDVVVGSVNANRRHYESAARALARADRAWLERLITRRVPLDVWRSALVRRPDDVKPIIRFAEG
jgi:threonine dehydrogenase-like Zn-dependent dehydrogenase